MRTSALAVVFALVLIPAIVHAKGGGAAQGGPVAIPAPQYRITPAYAKRLVSEKAASLYGRHGKGWKVTLSAAPGPIGGSNLNFHAAVNWGKGPHIALAVPNVTGTVNMSKGPGATRGPARIQVLTPAQH